MGSTSSTASSASSLSNPVTFTGQSTFSSSFQQVLQRAVSVASLPMQQLQNEVTTLQSQQSALASLGSSFDSLQSALQGIATAATGNVSASSSDTNVVTASAQSTTLPGTYSIQVSNLGSSTTTISNAGTTPVTDPSSENINASSSYTLSVNGVTTQISLTDNSLDGLASAINDANAGVSATIVNLGTNSTPDYRLALTSTELGADTIQLSVGTTGLLSTVHTGADAQYTVNGNTTVLNSNSDQVTLAPGLTATLVSADPGQNVNITVAASQGNLSSALSTFVSAYNAAFTAVAGQVGQSGGALAGQSLVYELQDALNKIAQFSGTSGSVMDLSDLGLTLSSSGSLSFDASQLSTQNEGGIQQFLGGLTSGGFLQSANDILNTLTDTTTGTLADEYNNVGTQVTNDQNEISSDQNRVNLIQASLSQQLSQADAAIAVLQQQNTYYTNLFQTENADHMAGLF
jgi:flagellar hook-associated protein 2